MNIELNHTEVYYIATLDIPELDYGDGYGRLWYPDVDKWCAETFGEADLWGDEPRNGWKRMQNKYYFVDEAKLNWFVLKWT